MAGSGHDIGLPDPRIHVAWANQTVLMADVVESVRSMERDQAGFVTRWLGLVSHVRAHVLPQHNGRFVKNLGDGMLVAFADVRSAASGALAIQQASREANARSSSENQILLRMGMEVSDVIVDQDDVQGHGVNLATRLMSLAGAGEIVVSQHVRDRLTPGIDADIEDLGDCFLRHVSQPVRAYRLGPSGQRPVTRHVASPDDLAPWIAVLPFASRDPADAGNPLGDVIAEGIICALSHSPDLNVISRLSTNAFRGREFSLPQINAHLHADYVLCGMFTRDDERISLDAELVEVASGRVMWTHHLAHNIWALLGGEQEPIRLLAAEVGVSVMTRELQRSKLQPLATLKAYTLLMGAIALMHRLSLRDFEEARDLLQALIDRGDRHAIPLAWLATWHVLRVQQGWSDDRQRDAYLALECTKRALDMDSECSLALAADGFVHTNLLKKLDVAQERYALAIAANPSDARAWLLKGTLHAFLGEGQQAVDNTQRALKLTPLDPHRFFYDSLAASACISAGQYDRALELAQRSLRANCKHTSTLRVMAVAQWRCGLHDEARRTARALLKLEPKLTVSGWLANAPSAPYDNGQEFARVLAEVGIPR